MAFSFIRELPDVGADGNPLMVERFTHILLLIVEMTGKEEESVGKRVKEVFEMMKMRHSYFYHVCLDGGVAIT